MNENQNNTAPDSTSPDPSTPSTPPLTPASDPGTAPTSQPSPITPPAADQPSLSQISPTVTQPQTNPINNQGDPNTVSPGQQQGVTEVPQPPVINPQQPTDQSNPQIVVSTHIEEPAVESTIKPKRGLKMPNKLIVGLVAVVVVVLVVAGFFILNKSSGTNIKTGQPISVSTPSSWKTVNTKLGYTVKAPPSWSVDQSDTSDIGGLISQTSDIEPSDAGSTVQDQISNTISVSLQKLDKNSTSETAFDKAVTNLSSAEKTILKQFGVDTNDMKITASKVSINGKPWLEVVSSYPGQSSANLFYWDKNQAIGLIASEQSMAMENTALNTYLLPMAASVQVK
jgi:hypothetical protein